MVKCELCGEEVELYYEEDGKILCMGCYDDPDRIKKIVNKSSHDTIETEKTDEKKCVKCGKKVGFMRDKLQFIDENGDEITLCNKCYDISPKEDKLKLIAVSGKPIELNPGLVFGIAGAAGYTSSQKSAVDKTWKKYDLSFEDVNEYAIINFNMHFLICDSGLKAAIMSKMNKDLEEKKLNELAMKNFNKDFKSCERKEKRQVKKEFKKLLKDNLKKNRDKGTLY
jgi:hypothetical protein